MTARAGCLALIALVSTLGCSDGARQTDDDDALRGELRIYRVSYKDGHVEREFYLAPDAKSSDITRLDFAADPELAPWTRLKVWGVPEHERIRVERYEIDEASDGVASTTQALIDAPQRTRTVGFVLADVGGGVNISAADARTAIFGTRNGDPGLWEYYLESSYGTLNFTGEVLGPTSITDLGTCETADVVRNENRWASVFGKQFDHWMTYIGSRYQECGWGGIGGEGTAGRPAYGSWYNGSTGCVVLAQEVGHNLGLNHAGTMDCGDTIMPDDPRNGCTGTEYGNRYTPMGGGCLHMNAYEKWYEGFLGKCNGVKVRSNGSFTLLPIELECNGVQALQIPMAKQRAFRNTTGSRDVNLNYYYLELRTRRGMDDRGTNGAVTGPTVLVHVVGDVPQPNVVSTFTWQLDMVPSTSKFDGMSAGQKFDDPAGGASFTVSTLDNDHAVIDVTLQNGGGATTCMDGSAFTAPGPASCGDGGGGSSGTGGTSGAGGSAGTGGTGGTGGTSGSGGAAGTSSGGTGGDGGSSGSAAGGSSGSDSGGSAGTGVGGTGEGGTAGPGGSGTGGSGTAGVGGASGPGGNAGAAGSGTVGGGAAGASGSGGRSPGARPAVPVDENEGCACRSSARSNGSWLALALPLFVAVGRRRRRPAPQA